MKILVSEIFETFQGEPQPIGEPALFIRLSLCNLKCKWCDTKYSWKKEQETDTEEIVKTIKEAKKGVVIFTGGEPLLQRKAISEILKSKLLKRDNFTVYIETNGTQPPLLSRERGLHKVRYNVSPKLSSSGNAEKTRYNKKILKKFVDKRICSVFKFVVSNNKDWQEMKKIVVDLKIPKEKVWVMPNALTAKEYIKNARRLALKVLKTGYNLAPRMQVIIWDKKRGV